MSKQMSKRALKQFQYELEDRAKKIWETIPDLQNKDIQKRWQQDLQVVEYFIDQVKTELKYIDESACNCDECFNSRKK